MFMTLCEHIAGKEFIMADEKTVINVDLNMFGQDADAKTAAANEVAKSLGISDEALAQVEDCSFLVADGHYRQVGATPSAPGRTESGEESAIWVAGQKGRFGPVAALVRHPLQMARGGGGFNLPQPSGPARPSPHRRSGWPPP